MKKQSPHILLAHRAPAPVRRCPSNAVLNMIADKWSALVISRLYGNRQRHGELLGSIEGISQRMLTLTLRDLERHGLLTRIAYPEVPLRVEYELTELGRNLYDQAIRPLCIWALEHMDEVVQARDAFDNAPT